MKEIFLSFNPVYFKPLLYGIKKYEYRKRFCEEETKAYIYLSGKSRQVVGILELEKPIRLDKSREDYINYPETLKRVDQYILKKEVNAIPIKSFTLFEKPLSLEEIRKEIPNFMPPQMYYVLENYPKLKKLLMKQTQMEKLFTHKQEAIDYDNLAMSVRELEKTKEFKKLDKLYMDKNKFSNLKLK